VTFAGFLGWLGNACCFSRVLVQWLHAERYRTSEAPLAFWLLSLLGSVLLGVYAIERGEPVLLVGFAVGGAVDGRNVMLILRTPRSPAPDKRPDLVIAAGAMVAIAGAVAAHDTDRFSTDSAWLLCAVTGQMIWSSRFIVQWYRSERVGRSHFPPMFWWLSLLGNSLLLAYAVHLRDPVFIAGLALGPFVQVRNLLLATAVAQPAGAAPPLPTLSRSLRGGSRR